jgi:hypothetical protein
VGGPGLRLPCQPILPAADAYLIERDAADQGYLQASGEWIGAKRVGRLMHAVGIFGASRKRSAKTTKRNHRATYVGDFGLTPRCQSRMVTLVSTEAMTCRFSVALLAIVALTTCSFSHGDQIVAEDAIQELEGRSFRQFDPSVDGRPRKAVVLDFTNGVSLWAQYAENVTSHEWEIYSREVLVEVSGNMATFTMVDPRSRQLFPSQCDSCIPTSGVSVSVRDVLRSDEIAFRLNDPQGVLPPPFPVFGTWTRFDEDEIMDQAELDG